MPSMCLRIRLRDPVEQVFEKVQAADEGGRGEPVITPRTAYRNRAAARRRIDTLERRQMRHDKGRLLAEEYAADKGRRSGRDRYRQKGPRR